jgi:predicted 3-demethylubiquinone-9 3-methyltransferase (glyoxalase superfamily)
MEINEQKITPCLWFDTQAEEAAKFYTSIFDYSEIGHVSRYSKESAEASGKPEGAAMTVSFRLAGQEFVGLNGGPQFKFTEAISFQVSCESQEEVDYLWEKLTDGGEEGQCGWLKDRFGVSWQIIPTAFYKLMSSGDAEKSRRVMEAMLQMTKFDIETLENA